MYNVIWFDGYGAAKQVDCDEKRDAIDCAIGQSVLWGAATVYKNSRLYKIFAKGKEVKV